MLGAGDSLGCRGVGVWLNLDQIGLFVGLLLPLTSRFGALGLRSEDMRDIPTQQYSGGFSASPSIW